ncbi:helix-turn-helix transcriptional regulator [Streptomyces sp. NPDC001941]|uniref:helix-turn-helix domain-containing protein n=1 Tax=Streptomyces sp. NPDC001941 TaxID=3154659 RepID=UPI003325039C
MCAAQEDFTSRSGEPYGAGRALSLDGLSRMENYPSALKIILGGQLRRLRLSSGLSRAEVARRLGLSEAKVDRVEGGRQSCKSADARALLALYGVDNPVHVREFMQLLEHAREPEYWQPWHDSVQDFFEPLISLEGAAFRIRIYEPNYVPGLLQTAAYAADVIWGERPGRTAHQVAELVELRMERQRQRELQLAQDAAPQLWVAVREEALRWSVSDREVMRAQVGHLIECVERREAAVQVVQPEAMGVAALTGNVTYLRFGRVDLPDAVYCEQLAGSVFLQDPVTVEHHLVQLNRLAAVARDPSESLRWLKELYDGVW